MLYWLLVFFVWAICISIVVKLNRTESNLYKGINKHLKKKRSSGVTHYYDDED